MPKIEKKQVVINEIKEKLDKSLSLVIVDARGLTVIQDTELRRKLREAGVDYKVYKNTMMEFAVKDTQFEAITEFLKGPSTMAFSYDDATSAARLIAEEMKGMPKLEFKAAVVDGVLYDAVATDKLSKIAPREELLSKLLGSFKSPMSSFARVVKAIAEEKENGGGESVTATPVEEAAPEAVEAPVAEAVAVEETAPEVTEAPVEETPVAEEVTEAEAPAEEPAVEEPTTEEPETQESTDNPE